MEISGQSEYQQIAPTSQLGTSEDTEGFETFDKYEVAQIKLSDKHYTIHPCYAKYQKAYTI